MKQEGPNAGSTNKHEGTGEEESKETKEDPNGMMPMLKKRNIYTLSNRFEGLYSRFEDLHQSVHTIEAWCLNSIKDLEDRITSAFATGVDMMDKMEE